MNFLKMGINSPEDLLNFFQNKMKYGFVYRKKIFTDSESDFNQNFDKFYKLRLGEDFIKKGYGVCWDFCEFERLFFEKLKIKYECYFIESFIYRQEGGPTHTFAIFNRNGKWFWFEYAWTFYCGIREYETKVEALKDILNKFNNFFNSKFVDVRLYKTTKVTKRLDAFEFVEHCLNCEKVEIK